MGSFPETYNHFHIFQFTLQTARNGMSICAYVCAQCAKLLAIGLNLKIPLILLRKRTQTALKNIFNLLIFVNLTFRMLLNIHFQNYRYNFENYT